MNLHSIIRKLDGQIQTGPTNQQITHFTYDPASVKAGSMFVAVELWVDGHQHLQDVIKNGASAIVAETPRSPSCPAHVTWIQVKNSELALGITAAAFYGHPSDKMQLLAVTGTNGKSTTTWFLHQILSSTSSKAGLIGTIVNRFGSISRKTVFTTPPSADIHALLAEMKEHNCTHVAIEASSHGLKLNRLAGLSVQVGGFTNLTRDHLDFHQTMEDYKDAKWKLFTTFSKKACFCIDDQAGQEFAQKFTGEKYTISIHNQQADIYASQIQASLDGFTLQLHFEGQVFSIRLPLVGEHNILNALLAFGMAKMVGLSNHQIIDKLQSLTAAPGRLEQVPGNRFVFVDYAHTPAALEHVLRSLKPLTVGQLYCVFGAGGDRDTGKRPQMGAVAEALADAVVVTSDNPRTEDPQAILDDIGSGLTNPENATFVLDRRLAIYQTIQNCGPDDVVLIAGKGHEDYQIIGSTKHYFDDREEAKIALRSI